jgi:hypothetical protein
MEFFMIKTKLISIFLLILLFVGIIPVSFVTSAASSTNYYIDTAGSNSNNGTSSSTPWADFTNVNSHTFLPGDQILLKKECTWTATKDYVTMLTINGSGVTVDAYGSGANPIISGGNYDASAFGFLNQDNMTFQNISFNNIHVLKQDTYTTFGHTGLTFKNLYLSNSGFGIVNHVSDTGQALLSNVVIDGLKSEKATWIYMGALNINTSITTAVGMPTASCNSVQNIYIHNVSLDSARNCALSLMSCRDAIISDLRMYNNSTEHYDTGTTSVFLWITKNLKFINCMVTDTPNSLSNDQCAIDNEFAIDSSIYNGCFFANNAGAALEFSALPDRPGDFNTNHQVNSCTFVNNGTAESSHFRGSLFYDDLAGKNNIFTGVATNNIFSESYYPGDGNWGFTNQWDSGNFDGWTLSNNTSVLHLADMFNAGDGFSGTQGDSNWLYQTYNGLTWSNMIYDSNNGYYGNASNSISRFDIMPDSNSNHWTARAYQAPASGIVQIRGWAFTPYYNNGGNGVQVRITKNGSVIWGTKNINENDTAGFDTNVNNISVKKDDIIRFEANCGNSNNNNFDQISWIPTVGFTSIEETPSTSSNSLAKTNSSIASSSKASSSKTNTTTSNISSSLVSSIASSDVSQALNSSSQDNSISNSHVSSTTSNNVTIPTSKGGNAFSFISILIIVVGGGVVVFFIINKKIFK